MKTIATTDRSRAKPCIVANRVATDDPRSPFRLPTDGWWQVLSIGEVPANWEGGARDGEAMVQVIDEQAITAIKANFDASVEAEKGKGKDFAGLLVDYDHFSHNPDKPTEAACWIFELEKRADGLWARGRWTGTGESRVTAGDYRFASAVLSTFQFVDGNRYRPTCLDRVALTNDPRLKNLAPITVPNRDNQRNKAMNERLLLTELLGLAGTADDAAITAGIATLRANIANATRDKTELVDVKNRLTDSEKTVTKLTADLIEKDLVEFDAVIENKDDIKAALVANRDGTLKILRGLKPQKQEKTSGGKAEDRRNHKPVFNRERDGGRNPGPADADPEDPTKRDEIIVKVRNRKAEILSKNPRVGELNATNQAIREIEQSEKVAILPR